MTHFCRRYVEKHFIGRTSLYFDAKFTEICTDGFRWRRQLFTCLMPNRRQAISWANVDILLMEQSANILCEICIKLHIFFFLKTPSPKNSAIVFRPQCVLCRKPCIGIIMMTSSNGNIFRVTGHLCGEFTGHRWIPRTKASDAELWCFLWSEPEGWVNNR